MNKIAKKVDPTIASFYAGRSNNRHDITSAVAEGSADISERLGSKTYSCWYRIWESCKKYEKIFS